MSNIFCPISASTFAQTTYEFVEDTDKKNSEKGCEQIKTWLTDESFHRYTGCITKNCLHGYGTYDWKYENKKFSYNGTFYINNIDGYGQFSYPDGSLHEGLMKKNMRCGPGVFIQCDGLHNVGFWKGYQLIRLLQHISSCVPHLASSIEAKLYLLRYRRLVRIQEDVPNPAQEVLSEIEDRRNFLQNSVLLYLPSVRHTQSLFINQPYFHRIFSNSMGTSDMFIEIECNEESTKEENLNGINISKKLVPVTHIVAWNNNKLQIHMLRHIFKHRMSEATVSFNVLSLLHCKRKLFRQEGHHESLCIELLNACMNGERKKVQEILANGSINPNVSDCSGNSGLMIAASQDAFLTMEALLNAGADVNGFNDEGFTPFSLCLMRYLAVVYNVKNWESAFLPTNTKMEASYTSAGLKWRHKEVSETHEGKRTSGMESGRIRGEGDYYIFGLGQKTESKHSKPRKGSKKPKVKQEKAVHSSLQVDDALLERQYKLSAIKKTINKLIRKGADPNLCEVPLPPLLISVFTKDVELVNLVLNTGANPDVLDSSTGAELTPLHVAAIHEPCNEMVLICKTLLDYNANPNIMTEVEIIDEMNGDLQYGGKMPLHVLSMHEDFTPENCEYLNQMATMLIKHGHADVNALFWGHTPLSWCIVRGNTELLRSLLETNRVDPNKTISEEIGVPLTVVLSEKLTAHLATDTRLCMCEILLEHGADPLQNVEVNGFDGNIMEFAASQFETKKTSAKKGKKDKKRKKSKKGEDKNADKMKPFLSLLSKVAQNHIVRHLLGNIINNLLQSIKNNVTLELSTMVVEAFKVSPDNVIDCLRLMAEKTDVYAEDAIKILKMFQDTDENYSEVLQLVHKNLSIIPYKKSLPRTTRTLNIEMTHQERVLPVMGKLSCEEIFPIKYPFPRLMSTADLTSPIILPPDIDTEKEVDRDGVLSFFHPKNYLKPLYEDVDDLSKNRNKAIAKVQQNLMRKQLHVVISGSLHEVRFQKNIKFLQKTGGFQVVPEVDSDNAKYEVCFECGSKKDKILIPCMNCRTMKFCSEKCYKASMGKDTLHNCHLLSFTEEKQILEGSKTARHEQEGGKSDIETENPKDRKELPVYEKEEMLLPGTESRRNASGETKTKKLKTKNNKGEKLFDSKKDKEKMQKKKEDIVTQKGAKLSSITDNETVRGKKKALHEEQLVNGAFDSSVNKRAESNVKRAVQSSSEDFQLRNKLMPSVALVLNFGADSETSVDSFSLPYVVLRDGCLYYRLHGSKPQLLENYSLL